MESQTPSTFAPTRNPALPPGTAKKRSSYVRMVLAAILATAIVITGLVGSPTTSAQTLGPTSPRNLVATVVSASQINLTWETPSSHGTDGPITGYQIVVSISTNGPFSTLEQDTRTTDTTYSHTGLSMGDFRRYKVAPINTGGLLDTESNIAEAAINVPTAPLNLTAEPGDQQVALTWEPPDDDWADTIQKYQVRHAEVDGAYSNWSDVDGAAAARTHTVVELTNGITYEFQVQTVNPVGDGAEGSVQATPYTYDGATMPLNLAATARFKEVILDWLPPGDANAATVEKYQIRYAKVEQTYGEWTDVPGGTEARTHTITGLTNFQRYKFQLNAITDLGSTTDPPEVEATPLSFGMWVTNVSIKRGSNVVGERKTPVYVYAPSTIVKTDTTFTLTWGGRPTTEFHPDNPTTVSIKTGEHIGWAYLWAAADQDSPPYTTSPSSRTSPPHSAHWN